MVRYYASQGCNGVVKAVEGEVASAVDPATDLGSLLTQTSFYFCNSTMDLESILTQFFSYF